MFDNSNEPIEKIEWLSVDDLNPNGWNPNTVFIPELELLERNILTMGWIQPIIVNDNGIIIDGFHRWGLSKTSEAMREKYHGKIPAVVLAMSDDKAMLLTIRMNRAKGTHTAAGMANIVKRLITDHGYDVQQLESGLGMSRDEVELLFTNDLWITRNLERHEFSQAWQPQRTDDPNPKLDPVYE